MAAGLPRIVRSLPLLGGLVREMLDPTARDRSLVDVAESLKEVGRTLRQRSPRAKVLFVDYLTLLPPAGTLRTAAVRCRRRDSAAGSPTRWSGSPATRPRTPAASGARRRSQPRAPRLVGRAVDDEVRVAVAGQARATAPQRGRHARGRRPRRRRRAEPEIMDPMIELAGLTKVFGANPCRRRPDLLGRAGRGHRLPRPERRGQDHHDADDPRARPPDGGYRDHRRPAATVS